MLVLIGKEKMQELVQLRNSLVDQIATSKRYADNHKNRHSVRVHNRARQESLEGVKSEIEKILNNNGVSV